MESQHQLLQAARYRWVPLFWTRQSTCQSAEKGIPNGQDKTNCHSRRHWWPVWWTQTQNCQFCITNAREIIKRLAWKGWAGEYGFGLSRSSIAVFIFVYCRSIVHDWVALVKTMVYFLFPFPLADLFVCPPLAAAFCIALETSSSLWTNDISSKSPRSPNLFWNLVNCSLSSLTPSRSIDGFHKGWLRVSFVSLNWGFGDVVRTV